ncbi:MAG: hypothetical protein K1X78_05605 [Verrucomicrobiaceae bacterium]|nr:hypothetical protein [Verrucomicrobiaceae bacterium]
MNVLSLQLSLAAACAVCAPLIPASAAEAAKPGGAASSAPVDVGGFGSDEPVERKDEPTRGIIAFGPKDHVYSGQSHWEQFDWKMTAKRWGHYQVRLTYTMNHQTLGAQIKFGEQRVKAMLTAAPQQKRAYFGEIFIEKPGEHTFSLYTPATGAGSGFTIHRLEFVPTFEGDEVTQGDDGTVTLLAKDATTWSENMRYEPKPEKNCLGYWTDPRDFAEWEFDVAKPGRFKVIVSHGCGGGNEGSTVAVKHGGQSLKFTVKDTGGFQRWSDAEIGEIEIKGTGRQRLTVAPENKTKSAVLDVQKVVLKPVG